MMYYIKMLVASLIMALGVNAVTYIDLEGNQEVVESSKSIAQELSEEPSTERFLVVEDLQEGYVDCYSLEETTNAPYGYILDAVYEIGDVVEVTYIGDEIFSERKLTGDELQEAKKEVLAKGY